MDRMVRARIAQMVFQDPYSSLNPRQTVRTTLAAPLRLHGITNKREIEGRIAEMLGQVGLRPEHAERYPHEFSGGQRQRIGIARALILRPKIVVLDEPVSALDVSIRAQIINLLLELKDRLGLSYIMISHDLGVVEHMSDRVAVMYLGRIVETGGWETIFSHPAPPLYARAHRRDSRPVYGRRESGSRARFPIRSIRRPAAASTRAAPRRGDLCREPPTPVLESFGAGHSSAAGGRPSLPPDRAAAAHARSPRTAE